MGGTDADVWRRATGLTNRERWATFDPLADEWGNASTHTLIRAIRDRVMAMAALQAGERVLDVGAGMGLLAMAAHRAVGPTGRVVALDLSLGALRGARERSMVEGTDTPLGAVVGDVMHLPFTEAPFDVVVCRSVLIYLTDRVAAAGAIRRVLRPGGRVALFEPINRSSGSTSWADGLDMAAYQPEHDWIIAYLNEHRDREPDWAVMRDFDERDLVGYFVAAGYGEVRLEYQHDYRATEPEPKPLGGYLSEPGGYAEAARQVLGDRANAYLARLSALHAIRRRGTVAAGAYLTARR